MTAEIVKMIIGALIGGGIFKIADLLFSKKEARDNFQAVITTLMKDNEDLRSRIQALEKQVEEVHQLRAKLVIMESAHYDKPLPEWLKDTNGVMLSLNSAYENAFLKPYGYTKEDYIGKMDDAIWDSETSADLKKHDMLAYVSAHGWWAGQETIRTKDGKLVGVYMIIKYARKSGNLVFGIGGIAVPVNADSEIQRKIFENYEIKNKTK